jgi:alkylglycerol monooxygenase
MESPPSSNTTITTTTTTNIFPPISFQDVRIMFYLQRPKEMQTLEDAGIMMSRAVPFFIIFIVIEFTISLVLGKRLYRINDTITSLFMGSISQQLQLWGKPMMLILYQYIHTHYRLVNINTTSWFNYIMLLCTIDLFYYFFHRFSHEYHLAWAMHSVHHSGEVMNLSTALRQGALQWLIGFFFNLPIALFIPMGPYFAHSVGNLIFQFWFHTPIIGWMGPLEYVINTPSSHRMHHRPPGNQNYGGVLIIWDRMFGTFKSEDEHIDYYGLAKQYDSFDPVWANAEHSWRVINNVDGGKSRIKALFRKRLSQPLTFDVMGLFKPIPKPQNAWTIPEHSHRKKFDPVIPTMIKLYCVLAFIGYLLFAIITEEFVEKKTIQLDFYLALRQVCYFSAASCIGKLLSSHDEQEQHNTLNRNSIRTLVVFVGAFICGSSWEILTVTFMDFVLFQGIVRGVVG